MAKEYVYKVKHKFVKKTFLLDEYGFYPFLDEYGEMIIAKRIILPFECGIVKNTKKLFENFYKEANEKEKLEDFKDYQFNEDGTVVVTDEMKKEWTECQLCFYMNGVGKNQLFINAPDYNQYFNQIVLDECIKDEIQLLLKNGIIYKGLIK